MPEVAPRRLAPVTQLAAAPIEITVDAEGADTAVFDALVETSERTCTVANTLAAAASSKIRRA